MEKKKKWEILHENPIGVKVTQQEVLSILLDNRGITGESAINTYLHPKLSAVTVEEVGLLKDQLTKAAKRINEAYEKREKVIVFGDYDVDGITGTAILWEALHSSDIEVMPYIPHRVDEGYGLSVQGIKNLKSKYPETTLIITVDNGIVANDAVAFANKQGIDVIITDHHTAAKVLPEAHAIVHTTKLCGAGVAYVFIQFFLNHVRLPEKLKKYVEITKYLDLVGLATIADLVPLQGANRTLVKFGLDEIHKTKRKGLVALFQEAQIEQGTVGTYEIGHIIGPRLNAMGRMANAMDSLRLLCTTDGNRARMLADKLGKTNRERQLLTQELSEHAKNVVLQQESIKKLLFIHHEMYEQGVIGLVAGKLVEKFYRPSIVLYKGEKYSKASARSIAGFNIIEFIRSAEGLLVNAGGHPMAAGFTVETEKLLQLQDTLESLAEQQIIDDMLIRTLKIDCELHLSQIHQDFYETIQQLEPFGMANPEPVFVSYDVIIQDARAIGAEGRHLKLRVMQDNTVAFDAIAFGMGEFYSKINIGDKINMAYTVDENNWNGNKKLQLKVKDIRIAGS